jgi:hypothetical protein
VKKAIKVRNPILTGCVNLSLAEFSNVFPIMIQLVLVVCLSHLVEHLAGEQESVEISNLIK